LTRLKTLVEKKLCVVLIGHPRLGFTLARGMLEVFRQRYNEIRPHWALLPPGGGDPLTPHEVYVQGRAVELPKWQGWAKAAKKKLEEMTAGAHLPLGKLPAVEQVA
jgi:hypothetical protein